MVVAPAVAREQGRGREQQRDAGHEPAGGRAAPPSPPVAGAGADVAASICTAGNVCGRSLMKPSSTA